MTLKEQINLVAKDIDQRGELIISDGHRRCVGIVARLPNDLPMLSKEQIIINLRQPTYCLCNVVCRAGKS